MFELMKYVFARDFILAPIYMFAFYAVAVRFRTNLVHQNSPLKSYLIKGLMLKMFGAILACLVYQYIYGGGDSTWYFASASSIYDVIYRNQTDAFRLIYYDDPFSKYPYLLYMPECFAFNHEPRAWTICRIAAILNFLAFDSYFVTSLFFSIISFYASWKFFKLITSLYPSLIKQSFYAIFCLPSVFFWGAGLFKDTIMVSMLLLITYHFYYLIISPQKSKLIHIVWLASCFYLASKIRMFFVVSLVACLFLWYVVNKLSKIKSGFMKSIFFLLLLLGSFASVYFFLGKSGDENGSEMNDEIIKNQAETMQEWHTKVGGSSYSLGITDYSGFGMMKAFPLAVNVSLFRPYLWEVHNFFQFVIAIQSLFFLLFTISTLYKTGIGRFFSYLVKEPIAFYFFVFSLLFSFICGFTSYNFGALDRYKIPALSFYILSVLIVRRKCLV
jgi:hypothetical protein